MGLDMYVYKAKKPLGFKSDILYNYHDLRDKGYSLFEATDVENAAWFADLMPFCVKINCEAEYYDVARIAQEFNLGENAHWCGFGPDGFYFSGDKCETVIPDKNIKQYCVKKEKEWYVTSITEVAYWRKHYELQDALYSVYETKGISIENCGYYTLNDEAIELIRKMSKTKFGLGRYKKGTLLYHEWY